MASTPNSERKRLSRWAHRALWALVLGMAAAYASLLFYALPRTVKAHITNTEVKRSVEDGQTDIRYVIAETLDGEPRIFRNTDTRWGFPPYFKFDSGTVAARASNLARNRPGEVTLIRYYGFRIPMMSAFPNVVSLKPVKEDYEPLPVFNAFVLLLHGIAAVALAWQVRRLRQRSKQRRLARNPSPPPSRPAAG